MRATEQIEIPAGEFLMGDERRPVFVDAFWIDRYPVTNAQYADFVEATGYKPPKHWESKTPPDELCNHPVVYVSWHDAVAYCQWLSDQTGQPYRLPTETEWEKAARGTDGREYPWGDEFDSDLCNTWEAGIHGTTPVGKYSPLGDSPYGCTGMAGNVWELTLGIREPDVPASYVLRGGSWYDGQDFARCAYRGGLHPGAWSVFLGFRCAT